MTAVAGLLDHRSTSVSRTRARVPRIGAGFALAAYAVVRPLLVRIVTRLGESPLRVLVR
ncbi:hypothetical protein GCM10028801_17130 [Nocardioides maradonensis]